MKAMLGSFSRRLTTKVTAERKHKEPPKDDSTFRFRFFQLPSYKKMLATFKMVAFQHTPSSWFLH